MGVFTAGIFLSIPIGLPLANLMAGAGYWHGIFTVQAVLGVVAVIGTAGVLPRGLGRSGASSSAFRVLREPMVLPALLAVTLYVGAFFTTVQFAGEWLDDSAILRKEEQRPMWLALGLGSAVGSLALARLSDRFGKRAFVLLTTALVGGLIAGLPLVSTPAGLLAVGLPLTMFAAARTGAFQALISNLVPPNMRGALMGTRTALMSGGQGLFSLVGGLVYRDQGFGALAMWSASGIVASYVLVRAFVREDAAQV
jgi:predicted MFS family arabinose efflux permease